MKKEKDQKPVLVHSDEVKVDKSFDAASAAVDPGDKALSAIGYFSILCILPLILRPKSQFCLFHGKQALAVLVLLVPMVVVMKFFTLFGFYFGDFFISLVFLGISLLGAFNAWKGKMTKIPPFSIISDKFLIWGQKITEVYESE